MRVGVAFEEDYLAASGPMIAYRKAANWNPLAPGEAPSDLRSFYRELVRNDGPHEGRFHYVSPNIDSSAWSWSGRPESTSPTFFRTSCGDQWALRQAPTSRSTDWGRRAPPAAFAPPRATWRCSATSLRKGARDGKAQYRKICAEVAADGYRGFVLSR
jgi:hypothetical protein